MRHFSRALAAGTVVLTLAACSGEDNSTTSAEAPAVSEAAPATEPSPTAEQAERDQAMDQVRDGAKSITEGAGTLLDQGRDAANRALEDAGPVLQGAGELAREVGRAAGEVADRAANDIRDAAAALNRRIEESGRAADVPPADEEARLAPTEQLNADTQAAARARPAGVGPDYVGVWAGDAAQCARIDQEPVEQMAVITPTTIRRYESVCNIESTPLVEGTATISASCIAEGETEQRTIELSLVSDNRLEIGAPGASADASLVRCGLAG